MDSAPEGIGLLTVPPGTSAQEGEALRRLVKAGLRSGADVIITAALDALPDSVDALIELAGRAQLSDSGLVGALAQDAEGLVQHAGVIVDETEGALLPYVGMPATEHGSFARLQVAQEMAAVAPWCLAVSRTAAASLLNETAPGALATVIGAAHRLHQAGRFTVWTPYAAYRLTLGADATSLFGAGLTVAEAESLRRAGALRDPYYHPALARQTLFALATELPDLAILRT
ncbi:hypothetical protein VZ95_02095 [Elstera litoralis]|uniref:Glycosyltransferase 2-like domain-containing protein n=1 Tax=Elstera litoralis TaxID=552518 RepID=A0A0F3IVT5_9PROT|nr:hypothetical protein [Elstera litoralis]KJV10865.1 hypothetical protein VZ95_02095 [Elstera litoralis]